MPHLSLIMGVQHVLRSYRILFCFQDNGQKCHLGCPFGSMRAFWNLNEKRGRKCLIQIQIQVSESKFDNLALDNISSLTMKLITSSIISVAYITERCSYKSCWWALNFFTFLYWSNQCLNKQLRAAILFFLVENSKCHDDNEEKRKRCPDW